MSGGLPHLIPPPRRLKLLEGHFEIAACPAVRVEPKAGEGVLRVARLLAGHLRPATGIQPEVTRTSLARTCELALRLAPAHSRPEQGYQLEIRPTGIQLAGGGLAGLFYGAQTLRQLLRQADHGAIPALRIDDRPDFPVRGFYHDVSRGKVPARATLLALVEQLAHFKVNQLQLYLEHTFAFARHPDIWAGADPLTADDIRAIDAHAAAHHIELVPSLSTFGHFYTALVSPRKHHLNELPIDASQLPFSWWDRMGHYTLDCQSQAAFELVRELILELRPLFRSKLFNLCCDETFDLGKGRNAELAANSGTGRLYVDFLAKLSGVVREAGAVPMFWGDIVGNHPELVGELRRDGVALDWDYSATLRDTKAGLFRKAGIPYYVCPGVCGWDRWNNDLDTATTNILSFARHGRRHGAIGLLNTDWGDRGHINLLGNSLHGIALGAAAGWNAQKSEASGFDAAFARLQWNDATGRSVSLMREAARSSLVSWRSLTLWLDPTPHRPADWWDASTGVPVELLALDARRAFSAATKLERLAARFAASTAHAPENAQLARREWLFGCRMQAVMNRYGAWIACLAGKRQPPRNAPDFLAVSNRLREMEREFCELWHLRNRPSEYWRNRTALLELARRLDLAGLRGVWVNTPRPDPPAAADMEKPGKPASRA